MPPGFTPLRIAFVLGALALGFALFAILGGPRGGLIWGAVVFPLMGLINMQHAKDHPELGMNPRRVIYFHLALGVGCAAMLLFIVTTDFSISDLKKIVPIKISGLP